MEEWAVVISAIGAGYWHSVSSAFGGVDGNCQHGRPSSQQPLSAWPTRRIWFETRMWVARNCYQCPGALTVSAYALPDTRLIHVSTDPKH